MKPTSHVLTITLVGFYVLVSSLAFPFGLAHANISVDNTDSTHSCPWSWQVKSSVGLPTSLPSITPNWFSVQFDAPLQRSGEIFLRQTIPIRGPPPWQC